MIIFRKLLIFSVSIILLLNSCSTIKSIHLIKGGEAVEKNYMSIGNE